MTGERLHRARSADGTEIVGRVVGQGPPLVLLHGRLEDGDRCWRALVPYLIDRFTCYLPSTRGRGLSGDNTDHSPERLEQDVVAFAESIDEPVGVFGESSGAVLALAVAKTNSVIAAAAYEPTVADVMGEGDSARIGAMAASVGAALERGQPAEGSTQIIEVLANDEEVAAVSRSDYLDTASRYLHVTLQEFQQAAESSGPSPTDASELSGITVPVLVMYGSRTAMRNWIAASAHHVADHVPTSQLREIDGVGHLAPVLGREEIADEVIRFFAAHLEGA